MKTITERVEAPKEIEKVIEEEDTITTVTTVDDAGVPHTVIKRPRLLRNGNLACIEQMPLCVGSLNRSFLRDLIEYHCYVMLAVVELGAQRNTPEELAKLRELVGARRQLKDDEQALTKNFLSMAPILVGSAHNNY
ncbi:MAG: hypothetical protein SWK76_16565 [Actinomycetota bacterium]|nr:hypothetical protein [Actinomycetota bacterium]